jgi:hypothetical protein
MKRSDLTNAERRAIEKGKGETVGGFLDAFMGAMWDEGVRNLTELDKDKFGSVLERLNKEEKLQLLLEDFLLEYAKFMRDYFEPPLPENNQ